MDLFLQLVLMAIRMVFEFFIIYRNKVTNDIFEDIVTLVSISFSPLIMDKIKANILFN